MLNHIFLADYFIENIDTADRNNKVATCRLYIIHVGHCTVCKSTSDTLANGEGEAVVSGITKSK